VAAAPSDEHFELLVLSFADIHTMVEAQHRDVTSAQISLEQYRHNRHSVPLANIRACLKRLREEACTIAASLAFGDTALDDVERDLSACCQRGMTGLPAI
jgi:hypothetical protein